MNYRHVYMLIIEHAKSEMKLGLRPKSKTEKRQVKWKNYYFEFHHVLPKSLYPNWEFRSSNLVCLTAREHFFCHQLLTKIYNNEKMMYALLRLAYDGKHKVSSKEYESLRKNYSLASRKRAKENWKKGVLSTTAYKLSDEQKEQMRIRKQQAWLSWTEEQKKEYHEKHSKSTKGLDNAKKFREGKSEAYWASRKKQGQTLKNKSKEEWKEIKRKARETRMANKEKWEDYCKKQSERVKGLKWVTNGIENRYISKDEINIFIANNPDWKLGRTLKRSK